MLASLLLILSTNALLGAGGFFENFWKARMTS